MPTVCFCLGKLKDQQEVVFNARRLLVELHPDEGVLTRERLDADPARLRQARAAGRHGADGHRGDHRAGAVAAAAGVQGRRFRLAAHPQPPRFGQGAGAPVLPRRHRPLPKGTRRDLQRISPSIPPSSGRRRSSTSSSRRSRVSKTRCRNATASSRAAGSASRSGRSSRGPTRNRRSRAGRRRTGRPAPGKGKAGKAAEHDGVGRRRRRR